MPHGAAGHHALVMYPQLLSLRPQRPCGLYSNNVLLCRAVSAGKLVTLGNPGRKTSPSEATLLERDLVTTMNCALKC